MRERVDRSIKIGDGTTLTNSTIVTGSPEPPEPPAPSAAPLPAGIKLSPGIAAAVRNGLDASNSAAEEANARIKFHTEAIEAARAHAITAAEIHGHLIAGIVQDAGGKRADYGVHHWVEIDGETYLRPGTMPDPNAPRPMPNASRRISI